MNLHVENINFSYNHSPVLKDASFRLEPGKILGVLGVNGAGKSTLLKCLNKVLKPRTGSVFVGEKDVGKMRGNEIARHFGYVPQKSPEDSLTVFDTVLLGRKPYMKLSASKNDIMIVENILKRLRCEHLSHRKTYELSGGEYQKVIIARALAQEPKVLLLDEPVSNLDLRNQMRVMNIVKNAVKDYGISAIISLHDINLALRFADNFLMLKDGSVHFISDKAGLNSSVIEEVYGVKVMIGKINEYQIIIPCDRE
jgi:iron complex transport system ATP-binding protein